jgi:NAD(P)-dependent dehydrogenase (short-subunit alcohol dehydrogenase family)
MDLELKDRVILVTGGSEGLGAAVATRLVEEGTAVAICARRTGPLQRTADALVASGGDVLGVPADVRNVDDCALLIDAVTERWGRLDGIVNNAGTMGGHAFADIGDDAWRSDMDLKLIAGARLIRLGLPALRASPDAAVVNVLNVFGKTPEANTMPSSVSRAAGMAMTKALSRELAREGIRVNAALVGFIDSSQWVRMSEHEGRSVHELQSEMAERMAIPLGRVGRREEFADVVAFLLSRRSSYVTGTAVNVDGGVCSVV